MLLLHQCAVGRAFARAQCINFIYLESLIYFFHIIFPLPFCDRYVFQYSPHQAHTVLIAVFLLWYRLALTSTLLQYLISIAWIWVLRVLRLDGSVWEWICLYRPSSLFRNLFRRKETCLEENKVSSDTNPST